MRGDEPARARVVGEYKAFGIGSEPDRLLCNDGVKLCNDAVKSPVLRLASSIDCDDADDGALAGGVVNSTGRGERSRGGACSMSTISANVGRSCASHAIHLQVTSSTLS